MIIENSIDHSLFPLKSSDSVGFALETFLTMQIFALPVVDNGLVTGFIDYADLDQLDHKELLGQFKKPKPDCPLSVYGNFFETIKLLSSKNIGCLAIVDEQNLFRGIVSIKSALNYLAESYTLKAEGGVICIEMPARNYSLFEINRIIENDDAKILGLTLYNIPESSNIAIALKLNTIYTERIIASLRRFDIEVTVVYDGVEALSNIENRYQSLIKYLEL